jgi:hypothetical protein
VVASLKHGINTATVAAEESRAPEKLFTSDSLFSEAVEVGWYFLFTNVPLLQALYAKTHSCEVETLLAFETEKWIV